VLDFRFFRLCRLHNPSIPKHKRRTVAPEGAAVNAVLSISTVKQPRAGRIGKSDDKGRFGAQFAKKAPAISQPPSRLPPEKKPGTQKNWLQRQGSNL
jgi:hypothetical protein